MMFLKQHALVSRRQVPLSRLVLASLGAALTVMLSACGSSSARIPQATASGPQVYMSPVVSSAPATATTSPAIYSIDDAKKTFAQTTYSFSSTQSGGQVQYSGELCPNSSDSQCPNAPVLQRGFLDLKLEFACGQATIFGCAGVPNLPQPGGWAFELAGQAGGLAQLQGQPFAPLVPAVSCPGASQPQTFLFVTLPNQLNTGSLTVKSWNPQMETAYGSVDVSASGSTVTLSNITQHTLLSSGASGVPKNPSAASITGICSSTVYGNTVSVPGQITITNPGSSQAVTPQALLGIGPSGLLVEDNGTTTLGSANAAPFYQNALGAGTGAIGLPKPSSALDTSALASTQYLGFFYGSGQSNSNWSTAPASFGFSSLPASCAAIAPPTSTMVYGGDFPNNNPTASTTGYGNCNFAVDLGTQDAATNGLYPSATVYVGSGFGTNTTGKTYSFPAVAIAGQLNGKYAIFLIGVDSIGSPNQAWGIYLLQSN
ncbi:MAG: hypothetical protein WDN23_12880 [Edaphobacter sp.]